MKPTVIVAAVAAWVVACGALVLCTACGSCNQSTPSVEQQVGVAAYGAELHKCVADAKTRAEADECRAKVEAKYSDGGAK